MKGTAQSADPLEDDGPDWIRTIGEWATDAIIFADRSGAVRIWNEGAQAIFGYSADEVRKGGMDLIIPERLRSAHWNGYRRAVESGQVRTAHRVVTTRSMHKDGHKLYVDLSFGLVRSRGGSVVGALAIGRDCTARHLSERALRAGVQQQQDIVR